MSVRVRFAPSPTGHLHIGGARTALYNYLFAKARGGKYILRIEDTDEARSRLEYEKSQITDLKWLGIEHDEGPDCGGSFGPYRQTERLAFYKKHADELIIKAHAYFCFCTEEELTKKKEIANAQNLAPQYDGTCRELTSDQVAQKKAQGISCVVRFKAPQKDYSFVDAVRKEVTFPQGMVGDFVILRANGLPVYNYSVVIDDWLMKITHVFRAEEHLPNTLRQLMIYEALGAKPPEFGHVSLIVNHERQKLSKRDGATSVAQYRDLGFMPEAILNYLCLLGWSHPKEVDIFTKEEIQDIFSPERFNHAAAMFDIEKFKWVNGQHLKKLTPEALLLECEVKIEKANPFHQQSHEWKLSAVNLFKEYVHFAHEMGPKMEKIFSGDLVQDEKVAEIKAWPTTMQIRDYLLTKIKELESAGKKFADLSEVTSWGEQIKNDLKIKGKPLFMGMRAPLTYEDHGPDLKILIPLIPAQVLRQRLEKF